MDVPGADSSELPDPVIEWYKRGVDRSLIRENRLKTHEERLLSLQGMQAFVEEVRAAGKAMRRRNSLEATAELESIREERR